MLGDTANACCTFALYSGIGKNGTKKKNKHGCRANCCLLFHLQFMKSCGIFSVFRQHRFPYNQAAARWCNSPAPVPQQLGSCLIRQLCSMGSLTTIQLPDGGKFEFSFEILFSSKFENLIDFQNLKCFEIFELFQNF